MLLDPKTGSAIIELDPERPSLTEAHRPVESADPCGSMDVRTPERELFASA